jgi:hypothetical protein
MKSLKRKLRRRKDRAGRSGRVLDEEEDGDCPSIDPEQSE